MVYQLSEKNQILVALFVIVVLCAGKLFKDYLFRRGYVEGLSTRIVSSQELIRTNSNQTITLILNITLGANLGVNSTITVTWPINKGITMSSTNGDYVLSGGTASPVVSSGQLVLTVTGSQINSGTVLTLRMNNIIITSDANLAGIPDFAFSTITSAESTTPIRTPVIVRKGGISSSGPSNDIASIQNTIAAITTYLNANSGIPVAQQSQLFDARQALINGLSYTYGTIKEAGSIYDSEALMTAQTTAIEFIKKEKARSDTNARLLKDDNTNKRRMAQVNTYYTRHYETNTEVMKNIIFVSVGLIIMAILRNKQLIPDSISTLGVILILTLGGIAIGTQVFDIMRRNDHDFDKYDWNFNEDEMKRLQDNQRYSDPYDLSALGTGMAPCYGPACCFDGTKWNDTTKKCVPVGSASLSSSSSGTLTIQLNVLKAIAIGDKITITLPAGFTSSSSTITGGSGTVSTTASFDITKETATAAANTVLTISISGMSYTAPATPSKMLTIKTTSEPTDSKILIMGI